MKNQLVVSTFWAMVLVIGTIISPVIVALINKICDAVIQLNKEKTVRQNDYNSHRRKLFEDYLNNLAEASRHKNQDRQNIKLINSYYVLLPYMPPKISESFQRYSMHVANGEKPSPESLRDFQVIITFIKQSLDPQQRKLKYSKWRKKWIWKRQ